MSFREFVRDLRPVGLPLGCFLRDAQRDPNLPDVRTWEELKGYLIGSKAGQDTIRTAFYFWKDYQALCGRQGLRWVATKSQRDIP